MTAHPHRAEINHLHLLPNISGGNVSKRAPCRESRTKGPGAETLALLKSLRCPKLCAAQTAMPRNSLCHPNHHATQIVVPPKLLCHPNRCAMGPAWERTPKPLCVSGHAHARCLPKHRMKVAAMQNPPVTPQKPAVHPTPGFHQPELGACEAAGHAGDGAGWSAGTRSLSSGPAAGAPLRSPQPRQRPRTGRPPALPLASV